MFISRGVFIEGILTRQNGKSISENNKELVMAEIVYLLQFQALYCGYCHSV